jgi:hypothetical protein
MLPPLLATGRADRLGLVFHGVKNSCPGAAVAAAASVSFVGIKWKLAGKMNEN